MSYMLCNFLGNNLRKDGAIRTITFSDYFDVDKVNVGNARSFLKHVGTSTSLVFTEGVVDGEEVDILSNISEEDISTDENPIIFVATKSFRVYENSPVHIRYIPTRGGVIVALIKGCLEVETHEGDYVRLTRNISEEPSGEFKVYNSTAIDKLNVLKDVESGVSYNNHVVSDCVISLSHTRDGKFLQSAKFNKDRFVILDKNVFTEGLKKMQHEKLLREEDKKRKAEASARFAEEVARRESEKEEAKAKKSKPKTQPKKENSAEGVDGASSFLAYVESLRGGK